MTAATFSGPAAAELVGITYRQLDYWARTDLVRPSVRAASGNGSRRRYSQRDLFVLKTIKRLLDVGIRLEVVRDLIGLLNDAPVDTDIRLELAPGCTLFSPSRSSARATRTSGPSTPSPSRTRAASSGASARTAARTGSRARSRPAATCAGRRRPRRSRRCHPSSRRGLPLTPGRSLSGWAWSPMTAR